MRILSVYSPEDSGLIRLWERSWRKHGWKPGLISPKELQNQSLRAAVAARKGRLTCSARLINYDFSRPRKTPRRLTYKEYGKPGWEHAGLVLFPRGMTEAQILEARHEFP